MNLHSILILLAVLCWGVAAFNRPSRFNLVAAGLALCGVSYLIGAFQASQF